LYGRLLNQIVQHWVLVVSCWDQVERSLTKAAQTLRTHWQGVAMAMGHQEGLIEILGAIGRCIRSGCRMNTRKKHPNSYQLFLAAEESCVAYA
jgi:hypothetical protein